MDMVRWETLGLNRGETELTPPLIMKERVLKRDSEGFLWISIECVVPAGPYRPVLQRFLKGEVGWDPPP